MQAPRGVLNVPQYQAITRGELDRLLGELDPLKQAYDLANQPAQGQQGGWQRPVPVRISVPYQRKIKQIEDQIRDDIDTVDGLCTTHAQYIQGLVDQAKAYVASTKRVIELTEVSPEPENFDEAARAAKAAAIALDEIATHAAEADSEYGRAWFPYRGNLGLPDDNIGKEYFDTRRKDIMARGKVITAKVAKCAQLHEQAKAYMTLSAKLMERSAGLKTKKKEATLAITQAEAKLKSLLETGMDDRPRMGWQGDGRNWISKVRALDRMARGQITRQVQSEASSWMADLTSTLKIFRNQVKTMETLLATTKKPLTQEQLKKNRKVLELAEAHVAKAKQIYRDAAEQVTQAQHHLDIIERAHV